MLKTWPSQFAALASRVKRFEVRVNDRDFAVGDILRLVEWDPTDRGRATGYVQRMRVMYLLDSIFGLPSGLCVMGVEHLSESVPVLYGIDPGDSASKLHASSYPSSRPATPGADEP
jgi:hypothetical protein